MRYLVEASGFEDMGGVDPVVMSSSHHTLLQVRSKKKFIYRNLQPTIVERVSKGKMSW